MATMQIGEKMVVNCSGIQALGYAEDLGVKIKTMKVTVVRHGSEVSAQAMTEITRV